MWRRARRRLCDPQARRNPQSCPDRVPNHDVRARTANKICANGASLIATEIASDKVHAIGASLMAGRPASIFPERTPAAATPAHALFEANNNMGARLANTGQGDFE
jgi:hypothetical protein